MYKSVYKLFNGYRHMPPTLLKREKNEDVCMYVVVKTEYVLKEGLFFLTKGDWKGGRREANGSKRKTKREHEFDQNAT